MQARDCSESLWFIRAIFEILADWNIGNNVGEKTMSHMWCFEALSYMKCILEAALFCDHFAYVCDDN